MDDRSKPSSTAPLGNKPMPNSGQSEPSVRYFPAPHRGTLSPDKKIPVWRVRFDVLNMPGQRFGLDINGEIVLGRGTDTPEMIDLAHYDGEGLGVSRRHLTIRPTATNLLAIDAGSKNGTLRNGQSIGVNTPYALVNGDVLMLGKLQIMVNIIDRPKLDTIIPSADFSGAISQLAKSITSQVTLDDVLNQIAETAMKLAGAGETGIWLTDEQSGELFLEAQRGIEDETIRRMRIPEDRDSMVNRVIKTGQPLRDSREPGKEKVKIITGYLVEAVLFLPIALGGISFGALMAIHRKPGQTFTPQDEQILSTIADFAAIAIQNARLFQSTDQALSRRVKELAALHELTEVVTSTLDLTQVHDLVVRQVRSHWDVEDVILWLAEAQGSDMKAYAIDDATVARIVYGAAGQVEKIIQDVRQTGQPKTADFLSQEEELAGAGKRGTIKIQARSIACIPLRIQDEVAGVLSLFRKKSGMFNADDLEHLQAFANPVASAIQNARLFANSERQRAAIYATANALIQPLLILDDDGRVLINNQPAQTIIDDHMGELFNGLSTSIGTTTELKIGDLTYLTTSEHTLGVGTIVVMQDISYVKELEKDRVEFVYTLTHDLKSPVTSIKGWAQLLEKVTDLGDKGAKFVGHIVSSSDQMIAMINDLLKSMSEEESIQVSFQRCSLDDLVERAIADSQGAALGKAVHVTFDKPKTQVHLFADENRLYHMALNLINNAIKYSPENGRIEVKVATDEQFITMKVQDTGPGIPDDELPHIFDRYFRGKEAKQTHPGAGLGLSAVRAIARAHSGDVVVTNLPEGGAEFVVSLPRSLQAEETPA